MNLNVSDPQIAAHDPKKGYSDAFGHGTIFIAVELSRHLLTAVIWGPGVGERLRKIKMWTEEGKRVAVGERPTTGYNNPSFVKTTTPPSIYPSSYLPPSVPLLKGNVC